MTGGDLIMDTAFAQQSPSFGELFPEFAQATFGKAYNIKADRYNRKKQEQSTVISPKVNFRSEIYDGAGMSTDMQKYRKRL